MPAGASLPVAISAVPAPSSAVQVEALSEAATVAVAVQQLLRAALAAVAAVVLVAAAHVAAVVRVAVVAVVHVVVAVVIPVVDAGNNYISKSFYKMALLLIVIMPFFNIL